MCLGGFKGAKQQPGASWTRAISAWGTKTASTEAGGGDHKTGRKAMTPITSLRSSFRSMEEEEREEDTIAETC